MLPLFAALLSSSSILAAPKQRPFLSRCSMAALSRATFHFDFPHIPYAAGVHHIHSPEHISEAHGLGAPFFRVEGVDPPCIMPKKSSISFVCSTPFAKNMRVRMFATQPNESNLFFFKDNRALYGVRFSVVPMRAFTSHRLCVDMTAFSEGNGAIKTLARTLLPIVLLVRAVDDTIGCSPEHENEHFKEYRRAVLRGKCSDEFWIMAERVMSDYSA